MEMGDENIKEEVITTQVLDNLKERDHSYFQVDLLKAAMIFLVIFDHTVPWELKNFMGVALWERISIPIFLIIMGFNMGYSFKRTGEKSLKKLYSRKYFIKKFWRYFFPFLVLYIISTIFGLIVYDFNFELLWFGQHYDAVYGHWRWDMVHLLICILPFYGPGNWFIPVLFWSILIMPLIYKGFSGSLKWSIITLILCYMVELSIYLFIYFYLRPFVPNWGTYYAFFSTSPFFMLSAIGLGMWFSRDHDIFSDRNLFMWFLFPISLIYLIARQFYGIRIPFLFGDYHLLVFPYSAFLFLIAMYLIPDKVNNENFFIRRVRKISKATYHILLTQIFYFGIAISIWGGHYGASILGIDLSYDPPQVFGYLLLNCLICIPIGVFWWNEENKIREDRYYRKISK
jgi:hypothetical protein